MKQINPNYHRENQDAIDNFASKQITKKPKVERKISQPSIDVKKYEKLKGTYVEQGSQILKFIELTFV